MNFMMNIIKLMNINILGLKLELILIILIMLNYLIKIFFLVLIGIIL